MVLRDPLGILVRRDFKDFQDSLELPVYRDLQEHLDSRGLKDRLVFLVYPDQLGAVEQSVSLFSFLS